MPKAWSANLFQRLKTLEREDAELIAELIQQECEGWICLNQRYLNSVRLFSLMLGTCPGQDQGVGCVASLTFLVRDVIAS